MLSLFTQSALALSCIWGVHDANIDEGSIVPSDAVLLLAHTYEPGTELDVVLTGPEGQVPYSIQVEHNWARLTPDELLAPGTYTLDGAEEMIGFSFEVTDAIDDEPPGTPSIVSARREHENNEWGKIRGVDLEIEGANEADLWYEYQIATDDTFSDAWTHLAPQNVFLGRGLCQSTFPGYDAKTRYHVRTRAIDASGNPSEWSDVEQVGLGLGCSSTAGAGSVMLGVFGLLGLRRRR